MPSVWRATAMLFIVLAAALVVDNYAYFFHTSLYEFDDLAQDSLQITRAKHFFNLYGQYSRWRFHHPGPAFFYVQAWGEMLFYDWLHLVPRPLNGQMLITLLLNVFFIATMLATAMHWIGQRTLFLPLALLLGTLHVPATSALFLIGNWPSYTIVVPFAALLVIGSSVAAGRGESLPLLALTCCFLAHGHVAQPLFIVPLFLLGYAGLVFACLREDYAVAADGGSTAEATGRLRRGWTVLTCPWRAYPRSCWLTAVIIGIFLLPILIDLSWGSQSNLAQILAFRHAHHAERHKTLIRSFLYFVQYALYGQYNPTQESFGDYTDSGIDVYLRAHRFGCELWIGGLLGSLAVMVSWLQSSRGQVATGATSMLSAAGAVPNGTSAAAALVHARRLYTVWLWGFVAAAFVLTLVWGCIMDGEMLYYNAYFNNGLCYAAMLAIAAVAADYLADFGRRGAWTPVFLYALVVVLCLTQTADFRIGQYACGPGANTVVNSVDAALRSEGSSSSPRLLSLTSGFDNMRVVELALELERQGVPYFVKQPYGLHFGSYRGIEDPFRDSPGSPPDPSFVLWQIVGTTARPGAAAYRWPLDPGDLLVTGEREIDPSAGEEISFAGEKLDYIDFAPEGWMPSQPGESVLWSTGLEGQLHFRPRPVPAGTTVRVALRVIPFVSPGKRETQRLQSSFNRVPLGTWTQRESGIIDMAIPASVWNARPDASLTFHFPDAVSPLALGLNAESRTLAFAFQQITFRVE